VIKQEIGRGSFGAVHLAADQFGNEYVSLSVEAFEDVLANGLRLVSGCQGILQVQVKETCAVAFAAQTPRPETAWYGF
jgi:hypothetical protein